jgi:ribosome-associated protein
VKFGETATIIARGDIHLEPKQPMETTINAHTPSSDVQEPPSRGKDVFADAVDAKVLADIVCRSLDDDKAEDVSVIDLTGKTSIADSMVIATGRSSRQVAALADHLIRRLKESGLRPAVEGKANADWVIVDAGSVIVHIFRPEVRAFYNLEKMWGHGPAAEVERPFPMAGLPPLRADLGGFALNA